MTRVRELIEQAEASAMDSRSIEICRYTGAELPSQAFVIGWLAGRIQQLECELQYVGQGQLPL